MKEHIFLKIYETSKEWNKQRERWENGTKVERPNEPTTRPVFHFFSVHFTAFSSLEKVSINSSTFRIDLSVLFHLSSYKLIYF